MSSMLERAESRKKNITFKKIALHSREHNSFHTHLSIKNSWELLAKLSKESWIDKMGTIPDDRVDKSIYKFISCR